ncbi:YheC/YheD family protein [Paenibacillus algorifonticola]
MVGFITKKECKQIVTKQLSGNVPETKLYNESMLLTMLNKYKMVYVKPNRGTGGKASYVWKC